MKKVDYMTVTGLILAWIAIIGGALLEGISLDSLFKLSAFCIVGLGTFAATCVGFSAEQVKSIPGALKKCFLDRRVKAVDIVPLIIRYTRRARSEGLLVLDNDIRKQKDPFFRKCLQLLVDGNSIDNVRNIMEAELAMWEQKERVYENFFKSMGGFSPTLGIIGTVMGLIQVMSNIEAPSQIASGIATAFIATFYGVAFANLIFIPVASKLRAGREEELLAKEMILEGALAIGSGDSSYLVIDKICAYLDEEEKKLIRAKSAVNI